MLHMQHKLVRRNFTWHPGDFRLSSPAFEPYMSQRSSRGRAAQKLSRGVLLARILSLVTMAAALICGLSSRAEDWPCWRGPRVDGTSLEPHIPMLPNELREVAWKTELPG